MEKILIGIAWDYIKSALGSRLEESWPGLLLGYFAHLFWPGVNVVYGMGKILGFGIHIMEVCIVVGISGFVTLAMKDIYKIFLGPKIIQPSIKKITKLFSNGKQQQDDREDRA